MQDNYNREIKYLRISITERCNLRCRYCMPMDGVCKKEHDEMLTYEEILKVSKVAAKLGVKKIRLTGGEPLVKKDIIKLASDIKKIDGIEELCITTNGILLNDYAKDLKVAGVDRINISLDTLNPEKYKYITRIGEFKDAWSGIEKAINIGFKKIKINSVLIGGFNDDEVVDISSLTLKYPVDVRFIELMPMYDSGDFKENAFIKASIVIDKLKEKYGDDKISEVKDIKHIGQVARLYKIDGALGFVGLISAVSNHFCSECNRIRLTSDGKLKPCLHSNEEISIKGLSEDEIEEKFKMAIKHKPKQHDELSYTSRSHADRNMNQIGG